MKKTFLSIVALLSLFAFTFSALSVPVAQAQTASCGVATTVTLFAGQTIDAGTVTVTNDADNLYVTFSTANDWLLSETHLHVADSLANIPQNKKGNPKIGNFAYQRSYDPPTGTDTYVIAKTDLTLDENGSLTIAAHAVVVQLDAAGNEIANETGWADGDRFVSKGSWATYFQYTWQECESPEESTASKTETAFAYGGGSNEADDDSTTCFLNIDSDDDGSADFKRWGWTNGPLAPGAYSFPIYAGAGQCDINKGTHVGTLSVNYDGSTAVVTFETAGTNPDTGLAYTMDETHLYVGSDLLATNNGEFTVAPGQYPTIHGELANVTTDQYTISGLSGNIYVVAHAVVAGFPVD